MSNLFSDRAAQKILALLVANMVIVAPIFAQSTNGLPAAESIDVNSENVAKTSQSLLSELEQSEKNLYALFNSLNSSDKNDIICFTSSTENSDGARQLCKPVFFAEIRQQVDVEIANEDKSKVGFFARLRDVFQSSEKRAERLLNKKLAEPVKQLQQEIESLAAVHPNLLAQLQSIGALQQQYLQTVESERRSINYLQRENDPSYNRGFGNINQGVGAKPWFSAPPPGHTTPRIHFGYRDAPAN